ncbi:MAG: hypothetical protein LBG44_00610 [Gemmatimonadota bacterium]|jgi:hypothetical protein|nr:hypothetical protein [Gemmatimonadota bacterium]
MAEVTDGTESLRKQSLQTRSFQTQLLNFNPHPASEFEWEDLLVRIETMPRVLHVTLEEAGTDHPRVRLLVEELAARESRASEFLEAAAGRAEGWSVSPTGAPDDPHAESASHRFARMRARNFAMVQRRGIEVWGWRADSGEGPGPTVHQLMEYLAEGDVESLALIRAAAGEADAC